MGYPPFAGWQRGVVCLPAAVILLLPLASPAGARDASGGDPVYYRSLDPLQPDVGFILDDETFAETGMDFEFCDGVRARVDRSEWVVTNRTCDGERAGTFALSDIFSTSEGVQIVDEEFAPVGYLEKVSYAEGAPGQVVLIPDVPSLPDGAIEIDPRLPELGQEYFTVRASDLRIYKDASGKFGVILPQFDSVDLWLS